MFALCVGVAVALDGQNWRLARESRFFNKFARHGPAHGSLAAPAVGGKEALDLEQLEAVAKIMMEFGQVRERWQELAFYLKDAKKTDIEKNAVGSYILEVIGGEESKLGEVLDGVPDTKHRINAKLGDAAGEFVEYPPAFAKVITTLLSNSQEKADGQSVICFPTSADCKSKFAEMGAELEFIGKDITTAFEASDSGADKYDIVDAAGALGALASGLGAGFLKMSTGLGEATAATAYETIAAGATDMATAYSTAIASLNKLFPHPPDAIHATPTTHGGPTHQTLGEIPHHGIGAPMARGYFGRRRME